MRVRSTDRNERAIKHATAWHGPAVRAGNGAEPPLMRVGGAGNDYRGRLSCGRWIVRMIRETVRSEMEMPSIFSSPWIRGARQSGLAAAIVQSTGESRRRWRAAPDDGDVIATVAPRI